MTTAVSSLFQAIVQRFKEIIRRLLQHTLHSVLSREHAGGVRIGMGERAVLPWAVNKSSPAEGINHALQHGTSASASGWIGRRHGHRPAVLVAIDEWSCQHTWRMCARWGA